jgi:hypothetical protein
LFIWHRILYLDHIAQHIEATNKMEVEGNYGLFDRHKVVLRLAQVESARQQDNFPVAMKQMKNILTHVRTKHFNSFSIFKLLCVI